MGDSKSKSKKELVYDFILTQFLSKKYKSRDHLNISQIAEQCSVSEIPVREALRQLEGDGYVKFSSNKGAFASGINRNEISQLVQVKGVLEGFATKLAVENLTQEDIDHISKVNMEMKEAMEKEDSSLFSKKNLEFHTYICERCGNAELLKILHNLWKRWAITTQVFFGSDEIRRMRDSFEDHERIIEMIKDRNFRDIEQTVREHKFRSVSYWLLNPGW